MTDVLERPSQAEKLHAVGDLLGGAAVLRHDISTPLDAHEMLLDGLPGDALLYLVEHLHILDKTESLGKAVGISLRTFQRRRDESAKPLSVEQSGRTWKFAEILAQAIAVFGSQPEAEAWLERPAIGLNQRRPIDLLATPAGVRLVEDFLERLEHGVYM